MTTTMLPSNTICVSQEGPANALALNKDCTQVVIAGRNVFKVFSIDENEFSEVCNLRVGKNLNLNFSSIDVAWSTIEENTLATAATNGAVVVWNLGRSGRSKQEHVFSDHKRTVNKVSFHLTEPALLISGSQDGMMKCFDLRMKEVARTFISNTESIRDVQFSPHQAHAFAAVSENGNVQVWDVRRHERCLHQFTAHSGPVFACDWHPELPWLATASRDKTIKVWDIHAKPNLEHTIHTIASVGHVKWRPQKKFQVASCALVLDCSVHVWDVRRPHVPLGTFAEHRDVTTAIAWVSQGAFLSTSRDCSLYRHRWAEAAHPVLWANPQGVCVSARGELLHAAPERPLPALHRRSDARCSPAPAGRKQPTAGSLSPAAQSALERAFPGGASSTLSRLVLAPPSPVLNCAQEYRIRGAAPHLLAEHNAQVALKHDRPLVAHVWEVVRAVCAARSARGSAVSGLSGGGAEGARRIPAPPAPPADPPPRSDPPPPPPLYSAVEEEPLEEVEEWETQFHNSGVLGLPTQTIYVPPAKYLKHIDDSEDGGWVSALSAHYVDIESADWTLPEEAFPLRSAPPAGAPHRDKADPHPAPAAPPSSSPSSSHASPAERHDDGEGGEAGSLAVRAGEARRTRAHPDVAPLLAAALRHHADLGDVQTPCVVLLAMQDYRGELLAHIEESVQEQWLLGYMELLQRHKLWNASAEVVRGAWLGSVWVISQQSTSVAACCGRCGRRTRPHLACERCAPRTTPDVCAVCHRGVRGLFAWCQGCSHGGHLLHMRAWMDAYRLCPAGCGHRCQLA